MCHYASESSGCGVDAARLQLQLLLLLLLCSCSPPGAAVHCDIGSAAKPHFVAENFWERVVELIGSKSFGCRKDHRKLYALQFAIPSIPAPFFYHVLLAVFFVTLLKLSTRNASLPLTLSLSPSLSISSLRCFCKSNQNRNQMQIGIRLVCLRSLKRCISLCQVASTSN